MNDDTKPTARVRCLQDGRLRLEFDSVEDFTFAENTNNGSHHLRVSKGDLEAARKRALTFTDEVDMHTLVLHFSLQFNLVPA